MDNQQNLDDQLEDQLDNMDEKLNLTADQKDEEDINDENLEKEFQSFMQNLQGGSEQQGDSSDPMMSQLTNLMSDLFKDMNQEQQQQPNEQSMNDSIKKVFEKLENNPQFDQFADQLLYQFMDKQVLEEPLKEAREGYIKFLDEKKNVISKDEYARFEKQLEYLNKILEKLLVEKPNKEELVQLFEKMQEYGNPPEDVFGADSPLFMMQQLSQQQQENQQQQQQQQQQEIPPQFPKDECTIF